MMTFNNLLTIRLPIYKEMKYFNTVHTAIQQKNDIEDTIDEILSIYEIWLELLEILNTPNYQDNEMLATVIKTYINKLELKIRYENNLSEIIKQTTLKLLKTIISVSSKSYQEINKFTEPLFRKKILDIRSIEDILDDYNDLTTQEQDERRQRFNEALVKTSLTMPDLDIVNNHVDNLNILIDMVKSYIDNPLVDFIHDSNIQTNSFVNAFQLTDIEEEINSLYDLINASGSTMLNIFSYDQGLNLLIDVNRKLFERKITSYAYDLILKYKTYIEHLFIDKKKDLINISSDDMLIHLNNTRFVVKTILAILICDWLCIRSVEGYIETYRLTL